MKKRFVVKVIPSRKDWGNPWGIYDKQDCEFVDGGYKYKKDANGVAATANDPEWSWLIDWWKRKPLRNISYLDHDYPDGY